MRGTPPRSLEVELVDKKRGGPILIVDLLERMSAVKYPALSEEEEGVSIPLQVLCLALFDAILLHMLNSVSKDSWQVTPRLLRSQTHALSLSRVRLRQAPAGVLRLSLPGLWRAIDCGQLSLAD